MVYFMPKLFSYIVRDDDGFLVDERPHICNQENWGHGQKLYTPVKKLILGVYIVAGRTFPSWPDCFEEKK